MVWRCRIWRHNRYHPQIPYLAKSPPFDLNRKRNASRSTCLTVNVTYVCAHSELRRSVHADNCGAARYCWKQRGPLPRCLFLWPSSGAGIESRFLELPRLCRDNTRAERAACGVCARFSKFSENSGSDDVSSVDTELGVNSVTAQCVRSVASGSVRDNKPDPARSRVAPLGTGRVRRASGSGGGRLASCPCSARVTAADASRSPCDFRSG